MDQKDRRVRRTQKLLMNALIELSIEKGFDRVTIRDITERADVAYSTFFRHYADPQALLEATIGQELHSLLTLIGDPKLKHPIEVGILLFNHVKANESFYLVILSAQGINPILASVQKSLEAQIAEGFTYPTAFPPAIITNHLVTAILSLVRWWLNNGQPYPVVEMARIYADLIIIPTERAAMAEPSL